MTPTPVLVITRYFATTLAFEHRPERPYDPQDASHLYMPNGSQVASFCPTFLSAAAPYVLEQWREAA